MSLINTRVQKSHAFRNRPYYGRGLNGPLLFWVLLTPSLILFIGIIFYPLFNTILLSFQSLNLADPLDNNWVGLKNYVDVLTRPTYNFWSSAGFSLLFSVVTTCVSFAIGFLFAIILNQRLRFQMLWRGLALIPWVIPYVVVAYLFFYMYNSQYGIINQLLTSINILGWHPFPQPLAWFGGDGKLAVVAVIFASIWNKFPFFTLMLLAGLQTVQQDLLDAATVDGAGMWGRFWHVIVPQLRGIIVVVTTLQFIWSLNEFTIIYSMTQGGPGNATNNIIVNIYRTGFMNQNISIAATMGTIWLIMLLLLTNFYIRVMEGKAGSQ
ncbi:ABC transporter permease [Ktedonobacter sp. SOSP1-52]|uniref:carbohydrate ABC transporter permease n=1 Tax=Ktedonobacter sp. SOSP1-52 TaxID=2778366 RepID=UPI0019156E01|nr:sugar ABC transporter permease [Ktedonobacter sp. SOSP1-52]GHO68149.1 ABC transporter permease [Ktedonobacter sp. SOSP1-52]